MTRDTGDIGLRVRIPDERRKKNPDGSNNHLYTLTEVPFFPGRSSGKKVCLVSPSTSHQTLSNEMLNWWIPLWIYGSYSVICMKTIPKRCFNIKYYLTWLQDLNVCGLALFDIFVSNLFCCLFSLSLFAAFMLFCI